MLKFTAEIDGIQVMDRSFNRVSEYISDFRPLWPYVATEIYAIDKEQFDSQGAHGLSGTWAKLSPAYAKWKEIHYPGMPILQATGALYQSLTSPDAADSIFRPEADQLTIGTQREGATAHQRGSGLPARPEFSFTEADKRRITKSIQLPLVQFVRKQGFVVLENAA